MSETFKYFLKQLNAIWVIISIGITAWIAYAFSLTNILLLVAICCTIYVLIYIIVKFYNKSVEQNNLVRKANEETKYQEAIFTERVDKIKRFYRTLSLEDKEPFFNIFKFGEPDNTYRNVWIVKRDDFFDMKKRIFTIDQYSTGYNQYLWGIALTKTEETKNAYIISIEDTMFQLLYTDFKNVMA